ncbi:hypothetical protein [Duganella fentianensis]|uniref:hypothetical protein n=1 Tax=Duganella fentianensis TaxID=2692177 RepID=UPI0032B2CDE3
MSHIDVPKAVQTLPGEGASRRQIERAVPGVPGLRLAIYPSGRRTYIYRFRDPISGRKTCHTLGTAD